MRNEPKATRPEKLPDVLPGERAVLVSSPDEDDFEMLAHELEILDVSLPSDPHYLPRHHYKCRWNVAARPLVDIHRDATWRPVEAETKAEAPAGDASDNFLYAIWSGTFKGDTPDAREVSARRALYNAGRAEVAELRRELEATRAECANILAQVELAATSPGSGCLAANPGETTLECDMARPCALCRLRDASKPRPVPSRPQMVAAISAALRAPVPTTDHRKASERAADAVLALFSPAGSAAQAAAHTSDAHPRQAEAAIVARATFDRQRQHATGRLLASMPIPAGSAEPTPAQRLDCLAAEIAQVKGYAEGVSEGARLRLDGLERRLAALESHKKA